MEFKNYKNSEFLTFVEFNTNNISFEKLCQYMQTQEFKKIYNTKPLNLPEYVSNMEDFIESLYIISEYFNYSVALTINFDYYMTKLYNALVFCIKSVQTPLELVNFSEDMLDARSYKRFKCYFHFLKKEFSFDKYKDLLKGFRLDLFYVDLDMNLDTLIKEYEVIEEENERRVLTYQYGKEYYQISSVVKEDAKLAWKNYVESEGSNTLSIKNNQDMLDILSYYFTKMDSNEKLSDINIKLLLDKYQESIIELPEELNNIDIKEITEIFLKGIEALKKQILKDEKEREGYKQERSILENKIIESDKSISKNRANLDKVLKEYKKVLEKYTSV